MYYAIDMDALIDLIFVYSLMPETSGTFVSLSNAFFLLGYIYYPIITVRVIPRGPKNIEQKF